MKIKDIVFKNPRFLALASACVLLVAVIFILLNSATTKAKAQTGGREGYTLVEAVPGVAFEVNENLANYATAVLEINQDVDFIKNASYSYKNGTDTYMLFNMSQYIVVAKKGTNFNLKNKDVTESLEKNSLNGIWFNNPSNVSKGENRCSADVVAQVVITNTIYNDFAGKLVTLTDGEEEWSLFVGSVNAQDEAMAEMIKYVSNTFRADASVNGDSAAVYEVDEEDGAKLKEVETASITIKVLDNEEKSEASVEEVKEEPTVERIEEKKEEPITEPVKEEEPKEESKEEPKEDSSAKEETPKVEPVVEPEPEPEPEPQKEETATPIIEPAKEIEIVKDHVLVTESNQKKPQYKEDKVYTSSIYSMLEVGQTCFVTASDQVMGGFKDVYIRLDKVNNEETTKKLIDDYIKSGRAYYDKMEAPLGTHWESVSYSIKADNPDNFYINSRFVGLDGEKLKYRGISYSMKTYDINNISKASDGFSTGYVAFYAVPNGCFDYAIAFGEKLEDSKFIAYYRIEN